jgi:hypothetical protein
MWLRYKYKFGLLIIILHPAAVCDVMTKQEWEWMGEFACARRKILYVARRMGMSNNRRSDILDPAVLSKWLPYVLVCEFWTECTADRRQHGCSERSHAHINFAGVNVNITNWPSAYIVWLSLWGRCSRDKQTRYFIYYNESLNDVTSISVTRGLW